MSNPRNPRPLKTEPTPIRPSSHLLLRKLLPDQETEEATGDAMAHLLLRSGLHRTTLATQDVLIRHPKA